MKRSTRGAEARCAVLEYARLYSYGHHQRAASRHYLHPRHSAARPERAGAARHIHPIRRRVRDGHVSRPRVVADRADAQDPHADPCGDGRRRHDRARGRLADGWHPEWERVVTETTKRLVIYHGGLVRELPSAAQLDFSTDRELAERRADRWGEQ